MNRSVWASALTMSVPGRVTACGSRSEGKTPRNELTSRNAHSICTVSIASLIVRGDGARVIYAHASVIFEIEKTGDGVFQGVLEFHLYSDVAVLGQ